MRPKPWILALLMCMAAASVRPGANAEAADCIVIAHRGASGYLPEHTLAAYRLAIQLGADYIEPDLVMTRDGVPIARHEDRLDVTTNVASLPEFADRRRTRSLAGREQTGWFSEDFSLAEIRRLRAREPMRELRTANLPFDDLFAIPTLDDVIELLREMEAITGRSIGLYPELKMPAYFRSRGLDIEQAVLDRLADSGYTSARDPVLLQSFDPESLKRLDRKTDLRLVQLLWRPADQAMPDRDAIDAIAAYADGIGAEKYGLIIPRDSQERLDPGAVTDLVELAHAAGLFVHAWTFRAENAFLPRDYRSDDPETPQPGGFGRARAEIKVFLDAGIDGFFVDQPDLGRAACDGRD